MPRRMNGRRGFSMIEVSISSTLVAGALVAGLGTIGAAMATHRSALDLERGELLVDALAGEIAALPYADPDGQAAGETTRAGFDDIGDFAGYAEAQIALWDGAQPAWAQGWSWRCEVDERSPRDPDDDAGGPDGLKRVRVIVRSPGGVEVTRSVLRAEGGIGDASMPTESTAMDLLTIRVVGRGAARAVEIVEPMLNALPSSGG